MCTCNPGLLIVHINVTTLFLKNQVFGAIYVMYQQIKAIYAQYVHGDFWVTFGYIHTIFTKNKLKKKEIDKYPIK